MVINSVVFSVLCLWLIVMLLGSIYFAQAAQANEEDSSEEEGQATTTCGHLK
jgi:hypothetical protein